MILTEIRDYVASKTQASMTEIVNHFNKSAQDLQPLLNHWLVKGRIECVNTSVCGGGCQTCPLRCSQYYRYVSD